MDTIISPMDQASYPRACQPCKKRKSKCGKVKPCPSCICHSTQDGCYADLFIEDIPQWHAPHSTRSEQNSGESASSSSGSSSLLQTPPDAEPPNACAPKDGLEWPFESAWLSCEVDINSYHAHTDHSSANLFGTDTIVPMPADLPPLAQLPPINELEAAFRCYITEMQWQMVSVDQRMRKAVRRFMYTGTATWLEQAFFYAVLAIVGKVASDTNVCTQARYIRNASVQKQYMDTAALVMEMEDSLEQDAANCANQLLKAQIECLRAFYAILSEDIGGAIKHFDRSTKYAERAERLPWPNALERDALKRFAIELAVPAVWLSILNNQAPPATFEHLTEYEATSNDVPVEAEILQSKVIGIKILIKTQQILSDENPMTLEKAREILKLDQAIAKILDRPAIAFSRSFKEHYITDTVIYQRLFTSNAIRQTHLTLRCALLQKLCQVSIASTSRAKLLEVASESLQETNNTLVILQAPWHKIGRMAKTPLHAEMHMSVFANTLESSNYLSSSRCMSLEEAPRDTGHTIEMTAFVAAFDRTYNLLNTLGLLNSSTLRCAQMIKMVPIKPSLSLITDHVLEWHPDSTTAIATEEMASITDNFGDKEEEIREMDIATFSQMLYDLLQKGFEIDTTDAFLHARTTV